MKKQMISTTEMFKGFAETCAPAYMFDLTCSNYADLYALSLENHDNFGYNHERYKRKR